MNLTWYNSVSHPEDNGNGRYKCVNSDASSIFSSSGSLMVKKVLEVLGQN